MGAVLVILQSEVLRTQLYTTTSWYGLPGYASWCALGTLARALVGNYTPPTIVATCSPVLVILTSITGTTA